MFLEYSVEVANFNFWISMWILNFETSRDLITLKSDLWNWDQHLCIFASLTYLERIIFSLKSDLSQQICTVCYGKTYFLIHYVLRKKPQGEIAKKSFWVTLCFPKMGTIVHSYVTVSTLYAQHIYYYGAAVQSVCSCSASPSFIYSWFIELFFLLHSEFKSWVVTYVKLSFLCYA